MLKYHYRLVLCSYITIPKVYYKSFEKNSGALEMAKTPKMRPTTKHINLVFRHFRDFVHHGLIMIYPVGTLDQLADIFTKPLSSIFFENIQEKDRREVRTRSGALGEGV
jgi:hypothetical protein